MLKGFKMRCILFSIFLFFSGFVSAEQAGKFADHNGRTLRSIISEKFPGGNVHIGAAVSYRNVKGSTDRILRRQFGCITPENDFKQNYVHPSPGKWRWDYPDKWVEYAKKNKQLIRIHGPISPQCSPWAKDDKRSARELKDNLREYMTELCKRYNGHPNVRWLDVVNETVSNSGKWMMPRPGNDTWENPWPKIGFEKRIPAEFASLKDGVPLYIIYSFMIANKEAPDIKLVINQHGDLNDKVWSKIKDLVLYLRSRKMRVDGIGWQGHIKLLDGEDWSMKGKNIRYLGKLIDWAHANNLEFHVTENNVFDSIDQPDRQDDYTEIFGNIMQTILSKRNTGVITWNLWGLQDRVHYNQKKLMIRGLWDKDFKPKKSYHKIQQILENPPK